MPEAYLKQIHGVGGVVRLSNYLMKTIVVGGEIKELLWVPW